MPLLEIIAAGFMNLILHIHDGGFLFFYWIACNNGVSYYMEGVYMFDEMFWKMDF